MKYINFLTIYFILIICFSILVSGQNKSQKTALNKLLGAYATKTVKSLNNNRDSFRYSLENKNTFYSDLDNDGDFDAVAELFFCEKLNCHPTTKSSELIVYLNNNGKFNFVASKRFSLFGKINSIEDGKIYIDVYSLDEDDPQCFPELKKREIYTLKSKKLVTVKK